MAYALATSFYGWHSENAISTVKTILGITPKDVTDEKNIKKINQKSGLRRGLITNF